MFHVVRELQLRQERIEAIFFTLLAAQRGGGLLGRALVARCRHQRESDQQRRGDGGDGDQFAADAQPRWASRGGASKRSGLGFGRRRLRLGRVHGGAQGARQFVQR